MTARWGLIAPVGGEGGVTRPPVWAVMAIAFVVLLIALSFAAHHGLFMYGDP
jgi:hypothetical protein